MDYTNLQVANSGGGGFPAYVIVVMSLVSFDSEPFKEIYTFEDLKQLWTAHTASIQEMVNE